MMFSALDPVSQDQVPSGRRRVAAMVAAFFLPSGAGLVVLGRYRRALTWFVVTTAAYLSILAVPIPGLFLFTLLSLGAFADAVRSHPTQPHRVWKTVAAVAVFAVIGFAVRVTLRERVLEPFRTSTRGMVPSVLHGDLFFVDRRASSVPTRGAVVVFEAPDEPATDYVQRIVGLPGDAVQLRDDGLYLNGHTTRRSASACGDSDDANCVLAVEDYGREVEVRYAGNCSTAFACPSGMESTEHGCVVPPGHVFVMGDNRCTARDSRFFGPLPVSAIKGRATFVYFSWPRRGTKRSKDGQSRDRSRDERDEGIRWRRIGTPL